MSYQEKRTLMSMVMGVILMAVYGFTAYSRYQAGVLAADNLKGWALLILLFIGIGVISAIILQIIFHIYVAVAEAVANGCADEKKIEAVVNAVSKEDEMDKLIGLKTSKAGFALAGMGFLAAMISLALGVPGFVMLNILFLSFFAGSLAEGVMTLYLYRNGVGHGN